MTEKNKKYLDLLNIHQKKAVIDTEGACLVLAGAGSGKTRVLTFRLLHILMENRALPTQIIAVTFTNKAASEMKSRIAKLIKLPLDNMWIGTFHSLSAKILRVHHEIVGLKSNFIIIDKDDQLKIINQILEREKINTKERNAKYYLNLIDGFKNKSIFSDSLSNTNRNKDIKKIYSFYQQELLRLNCVDFGDLILHCIKIFEKNKNVLNSYQNQFRYILVDEYQDINNLQQKWLEYLFNKHKNICCVGDDDQSIYSWRGAEVKNLLNFEKKFSSPKVIRLEQNYRSTENILSCASNLIKNNKGRYEKKLWTKGIKGEKILISGFWETKEEAIYVSDEIEKLLSNKINCNQIAILFRVAAHTRSFEERFINIGMPYKIIGGLRFYERKEIKDMIAYLRLVNNLNDDLALERIINVPKRGVGKTTLSKFSKISRLKNISMFEAVEQYLRDGSNKTNIEINKFINDIYKWNKLKNKINHQELSQVILEDSNYLNFLEQEVSASQNPESLNRIENINEFIESLKDFENLEGFLEHVSLVMENFSNTSDQSISMMTMHSAKGLEFDNVFLAGWEEGVFPSKKSIEEMGQSGLEEERRLAYVAITRAKKNIQITYVNQNRYSYVSHDHNLPSRFIDELPKELVEIKNSDFYNKEDYFDEFVELDNDNHENISPGRKRLLTQYKKNEIEWDFNQDYSEDAIFKTGSKVFHQKFGYGKILSIDGNLADVKFEKSSQRQVFIKYLQFTN